MFYPERLADSDLTVLACSATVYTQILLWEIIIERFIFHIVLNLYFLLKYKTILPNTRCPRDFTCVFCSWRSWLDSYCYSIVNFVILNIKVSLFISLSCVTTSARSEKRTGSLSLQGIKKSTLFTRESSATPRPVLFYSCDSAWWCRVSVWRVNT